MSEISPNSLSEFSTISLHKLPETIIEEILLRLPAKSILKFRCVSPSWLSLLDSPYFIKAYISKSANKILLNTPRSFYSLNTKPEPKPEISLLKTYYPHSFILGYCNGLILSHHDNTKPGERLRHSGERWDVVLQNPYTRTFEKIPTMKHIWLGPKDTFTTPEKFVYGFWYDELTDDYKVLRNCQFHGTCYGRKIVSQIYVYSVKMKSYKEIDPCPYYVKHEMAGNVMSVVTDKYGVTRYVYGWDELDVYEMCENVFCGGALHWVVSSSQWICAFDVVTEKYGLIDQPLYDGGDFKLNLHLLGGRLCVVCRYFPVERFDVWVMKEYENVASWSKEISIWGYDIGVETIGYLKPLIYSECGKKMLIERGCRTLLWYDLEKKSTEIFELAKPEVPKRFLAFAHKESLIKLSCCLPGDEKKEDDKMPKRDGFLSSGFKLKL